jgi:hypothetical protein
VWVIKIDSLGNLQWQRSFGGSGSDQGYSVQQTPDGGYILAGFSSSTDGDVTGNHGGADFWIVKLDGSGNLVWQKSLGGSGSDFAFDIKLVSGGGYIVVGQCNSVDGDITGNHGDWDFWVVKLDSTGTIIWQNSYGGTDTDHAYRVLETTEGGYIVAGRSSSDDGDVTGNHDAADFWIVKLSMDGVLQWQKSYGGYGVDIGRSIQQLPDKGYIIAGWTNSTDGDITSNQGLFDFWVLKIDSTGSLQWQDTYGGTSTEWPYTISSTLDGGYVVAGYTSSINGDITATYGGTDFWIVKLNDSGILEWQISFGGSSDEHSRSLLEIGPGKYIVAGFTESVDGNVIGNHGYRDFWILKLSGHVGIADTSPDEQQAVIFPNPASDQLFLKIQTTWIGSKYTIRDLTGRCLIFGNAEQEMTRVDIGSLQSGTYSVTIEGCTLGSQLFVKL